MIKAVIQYNCIPHYRRNIFERLSARKDVEFIIIADSESDTPYLKSVSGGVIKGIRHVEAKTWKIKIPFLPCLYWQPKSLGYIYREKPDVIISLGSPYSLTAWAILVMGKLMNRPVLLWGHGLLGRETGFRWVLRNAFYRLAYGHLLYGNYAKQLLIEKGFAPERLFVVYNSLDYDAQKEVANSITETEILSVRSQMSVGEGEGMVVFTGRLQPVKRLDLLVSAIAKLYLRGRTVHVAFVGDGSEKSVLQNNARELGVSHLLHFCGESYDENYLGVIISASDISVIPSGAGLSVMHALVYGTPVILHDKIDLHFPEWEAVEDGKTGFFYHYNDVDHLANVIEKSIFPVPAKEQMAEQCKAAIYENYNPAIQEQLFVDAVRSASGIAGRNHAKVHRGN